jgi:hypothetical protein
MVRRITRDVLVGCCVVLLSASTALAEITVHTDFPGGSGTVGAIDEQSATIQIDPTDHPNRGWRCWWYVRLDGLPTDEIVTLDVGEAPWATPSRATFSVDGGKTWQHSSEGVRDGKRIRYAMRFGTQTALVAWGPPFVPADASALVDRIARQSRDAVAFSLCRSREQRETPGLRVAAAGGDGPPASRPLIWVQARQHAWESGSSWVAKGFAEWLVSDAPEAVDLRRRAEVVIVPIMDIDNVHRGAGGKNQSPQDHNRDWSDTPHWRAVAAAQHALRAAADAGRLAAFIDLHNPSAGDREPYFYVPPPEILSPRASDNLGTFLAIAKAEINGPLAFRGRTIASGASYDPKAWTAISKNWVARLGTPAVSVTLETAWNTPASTCEGYETVGRQLGKSVARFVQSSF